MIPNSGGCSRINEIMQMHAHLEPESIIWIQHESSLENTQKSCSFSNVPNTHILKPKTMLIFITLPTQYKESYSNGPVAHSRNHTVHTVKKRVNHNNSNEAFKILTNTEVEHIIHIVGQKFVFRGFGKINPFFYFLP